MHHGQLLDLHAPVEGLPYALHFESILIYVGGLHAAPNQNDTAYYLLGVSPNWQKNHFVSSLQVNEGDTVYVNWGVDSLTQVSGAMRGDLDPQIGMYWAWQSGYISAKLEGRYVAANGLEKPFTFHLGGYQNPCCSARSRYLVGSNQTVTIEWNMDPWLSNYDLRAKDHLMQPGSAATQMFVDIIPASH